jgi:hypothetical protein
MAGNKRRGENPIPANCKDLMTDDQIVAMRNLEGFGWSLKYVRRPKFSPVEVVLISSDGESYALLREDGELDEETPIPNRETTTETPADSADTPAMDDDLQSLADAAGSTPPEASPMVEPVPSSSNDALPDTEEIPPPKFLV